MTAIGKKLRFEIFKRDGFTCMYCGRRPPDVMLEVDHIHPRAKGGTNDPANLTTACVPCNRGKGDRSIGDVPPAIDETALLEGMQEAMERATSMRRALDVTRATADVEAEAIEVIRSHYRDSLGSDYRVQDVSLRRFLRDLPLEEILDAVGVVEVASEWKGMNAYNEWRYFCGTCWGKIRNRKRTEPDNG